MFPRSRRARSVCALVACATLLAAAPGVAFGADTAPDPFRATAPGVYVVTLAAPPAAS